MIKIAKPRKRLAILEMTPLVDVVFLLLVFFLLTSTSIQHSMDVDLPETVSGVVQPTRPLLVTILPDNSVWLEHEVVLLEDLKGAIQARLAGKDNRTLTIEADRRVDFGVFAMVLDLSKQAGAVEISLATDVIYQVGGK